MGETTNLGSYHNARALYFVNEGRFPEAIEHIKLATRYSHSCTTLKNKAFIYESIGDHDESARQLESALALAKITNATSNELRDIELKLANVLAKKGNLQDARFHYKSYLESKYCEGPEDNCNKNKGKIDSRVNAELDHMTGRWLVDAGNCQEAIDYLKKSMLQYRADAAFFNQATDIQYEIAQVHMRLGQVAEAENFYKNCIEERGTKIHQLHQLVDELTKAKMIKAEVAYYVGLWYSASEKREEAISSFKESNQIYKAWTVPICQIGHEYFKVGDFKNCSKYCRQALGIATSKGATDGEVAAAYALLSDSCAARGKLKKAIRLYKMATNLEPNDKFMNRLQYLEAKHRGMKHHRRGNYRGAAKWYDEALGLNKDDCELYFYKARCYYLLGAYELASNSYLSCNVKYPNQFVKLINDADTKRGIWLRRLFSDIRKL